MSKKTQNQSEKPLEETQHAAKPQQHRGKGPDRGVVTLPADRSPEEGETTQTKDVQGYTLGRQERRTEQNKKAKTESSKHSISKEINFRRRVLPEGTLDTE
jgi:hypothetical protein